MKTMRFLRPMGLGLALVGGSSLIGCGSGSDTVTPTSVVTFNLKAHAVTFTAVDAKTGAVVSSVPVVVAFAGPSDLSDATGSAKVSATANLGAASLYTDSTATVTALVTASGYLPASASIYASRSQNMGVVKLVSLSTPPTGVTISTIGTATKADFDISTALAYVPGSARLAGSDSTLKFVSVSEITATVSSLSLAATGDSAAIYYLAPGASAWVSKGKVAVSAGAVTLNSAAAGTWAVATSLPSTTVTFNFTKSISYDAEVTLSANGWTHTFRSAGDSAVRVQNIPTGVSVAISVKFNGKQAYFNTHTFAAGEAFNLDYVVNPSGSTQTFVAKCTDGTAPTDLTPGFPLLVLDSGSEIGAALVGASSVSVSGLNSTLQKYQIPVLDKAWSFTPSSATIVLQIDCANHIITGATGGSGN